jgi:hypothetical protein
MTAKKKARRDPFGGAEYASLDKIVKYIMKTTRRTRRQAEQFILQKLKSGEVQARGIAVGAEDLGPQPIPVEVFQAIPSEH